MINDQYKFIFVHIPKTGGTSIEAVFEPTAHKNDVPLKHDTLPSILSGDPKYSSYFKFTIVRNPWDIVCSLYHYMWKSNYRWPVKWREKMQNTAPWVLRLSFKEWIQHPSFLSSSLRSAQLFKESSETVDCLQLDWICDENGRVLVDRVCRFESLQEDFDSVCSLLGVNRVALSEVNKSKNRPYWEYYCDESSEIVGAKYRKDIATFGYEFGK